MLWKSKISKFVGLGAMAGLLAVQVPVAAQTTEGRAFTFGPEVGAQLFGGVQIGVSIRDVNDADVSREKLSVPVGAYVEDVRADSPADQAGMKAGDLIVSFDGERVRSAAHLRRLVNETPAGRTVAVDVQRAGSRVSLNVAPAENQQPAAFLREFTVPDIVSRAARPDRDMLSRAFPSVTGGLPALGVRVQELTGQLSEYFGATDGVLVTSVEDGTPAKAAGLKAGDVITKVNGAAITNTGELRRRLTEASGDVTITVTRDRKETELKAAMPGPRMRTSVRRAAPEI